MLLSLALTLSLLVLGIVANDANDSAPANDPALAAHFPHRGANLHLDPLSCQPALEPVLIPTRSRLICLELMRTLDAGQNFRTLFRDQDRVLEMGRKRTVICHSRPFVI